MPFHKPDNIIELPVDENNTLLNFLFQKFPDRSKTTVKSFLRNDQVKVGNSITSQFDFQLRQGDKVLVNTSRQWQSLKNPRLKIIFEDEHIIVVYKGYGLLSMGAKKNGHARPIESAYSILREYIKGVNPAQKIFIVHRLDQHTSGLMVFAKSEEAKNRLQHNWNNMVLERKYLAVVEGRPQQKSGVQQSYLAENSKFVVYSSEKPFDGAKLAVTRWRLIRAKGQYSLLEVTLDTGRKNQIRVHLKDMGLPIVGDKKYGAKTSPIHRLALHAATLRFVHPITQKDMNFSSPAPEPFNKLV